MQPLTKLSTYEFNIRSFHPEKDFGWSGLMFEGDKRGFSLNPSGTELVTSRIWQKFKLNTETGEIKYPETKSDRSKAPWSKDYREYLGRLAPKGVIQHIRPIRTQQNICSIQIEGHYGGENHAMPASPELKESIGVTYVPTLDVRYKLAVDVDRTNNHIDIVLYVTGDGFPNCEAFVVDKLGKAVFLGVHVRKGAAPVSLALNLDYPMIACAIRLPLDSQGNFVGTVGDELLRRRNNSDKLVYENITKWNHRFLVSNPNRNHCMGLEDYKKITECFSK
ncbi:hypothetical protein [Hahella sp. NBU794]|uniref:hypothetical protein n=1 Tax=Hahella sp. NBU794 TaxID=3422590 RepID=UPI003D6EFF86